MSNSKIVPYLLLCMAILSQIKLIAQPVNVLSNFMHHQLYYNPASAGMHETQVNINVLGRLQWASIEGAPRLGLVSADYRFPSQRMALGANVSTFSYSKYSFSDANLNYAYSIYLNKKVKLSMGLRAGFTSIRSSTNGLTIFDDNDPLQAQNNYSATIPKLGIGFQLNAPNYYIGFSAPDFYVVDNQTILNDTSSFFKQQRNFVLMAGAKIKLNDLYNLRPSIAVFHHPTSKTFATINTNFEIRDYFWIGASYSTYKSLTILAGAHLSTRVRFAYAYEFLSGANQTTSIGSHEVALLIKMDNLGRKKVNY